MSIIEKFSSGATSSKIPRFDLIPYRALCRLARRFELGLERHKDGAWNQRASQKPTVDREFVIQRAAHAMHHAAKLIAKMEGRIPDDGDDDAAAIMWSGAFLCEATESADPTPTPTGLSKSTTVEKTGTSREGASPKD